LTIPTRANDAPRHTATVNVAYSKSASENWYRPKFACCVAGALTHFLITGDTSKNSHAAGIVIVNTGRRES
jgi:hypothetical protein